MKLYHLGTYLQELNASLHLPIIADSVIPNCQLLCNNFVDYRWISFSPRWQKRLIYMKKLKVIEISW